MERTKSEAVLIAEDELEIANLLSIVFEQEQFTVYRANDGQEALEIFKAHADEIVLLFTDIGLPKLGGVELIEAIRATRASVKIIAVTGYGHETVQKEVMKAGGDEFFPKPFLVGDIVKAAKRLLGRA